MSMASDVSTAVSTAQTAIASVATQVALLESYRVSDPKSFYDNGGHTAGALRTAWDRDVRVMLDSLIRG